MSSASGERGDATDVTEEVCKVDKWNGTAVKNALDDAVRLILTKHFGYEENHGLIDNRLILCTIACLFAVVALIYDFLRPFPESRTILAICVLAYFGVMTLVTFYTMLVEKNHFLIIDQKDPAGIDPSNTWTCDSAMKRFDDEYSLKLEFTHGSTKEIHTDTVTKSVGAWFDEDGALLMDLFQSDVCNLHDKILSMLSKKDK